MAPDAMGSAASPSSPFGALAAGPDMGGGMSPAQDQLAVIAGQIRDIGSMIDQLAETNPSVQQEAVQMKALLRQMLIKASQTMPMQTPSAEAIPTAGM